MGSSSMENSLISRLENFDYKGLHTAFSDYLQPFSDFIDFNNDDDVELPKNTKKKNLKKKKKKCSVDDPKLIRPLAKQFLPFISRALKVLPNKLSEPPKPGGGGKEEQIARQLFDIYRLCLDCLSCISSCLDCKPFHIHFQRIRMVHCLEAWGRYGEVESEGFSIFQSLWSIDLVKGKQKKKKKVEEEEEEEEGRRFIPDLTTENAEPDLACLIMEIVVCVVKCAIKSQSKDEAVYNRVLSLVDQVTPWLRVMDSKAFERLHRVLVTNLYKCTLFMLGEDACFEGDLVHKFCTTTLTECLKSYTKDQFLKFAYNICSSLRSQWVNRPSLILDILQCVLESTLCECKVDLVYTVNESLNLVHYCLKRCRIANRDTCRNIERYLEKTVGELVQVAGPIDSILRLYATGFHFMDNDFQSRNNGFANSDSSKSAVTFLLGIGDKLQDLAGLLHSLEGYFHIASNDNHQSPSCAKKSSRSVPSAASVSNLECSSPCKNKHGKISLLSYLNAMEFFFHPFTELVNKTCIQNIPDKEAASLCTKIKYIQDALHQFCNVYFIAFSCTDETEKDRLNESRKTLLNAAVAAFILSLSSDKNIQKSVDCIDHIVSMVWVQSKEIQFLVSSLYNIGADLYNAKRLKLASIPLEVCCRASWTRILLLCKKFIQKSDRVFDDMPEESIVSLVTEACAKSITLLDVLHQCNSPDMYTSIVDSLSNWILARNLFNGLDVPALLVKKWVKIICKEFKDVDGENNAPTLYSLLLEPSIALEERTLGVPALLVKKWVKIMCKEFKDVDGENNAPSLYSLLLKSSIALEERTLSIISIIFEQELLTYEEMEAQNINLCRRMQLKIMDIFLLNIYVSEDYCLQKSRMLIKKGRMVRTCGSEGMNSCITCLSEAICVLEQVNTSSESACRSAQAFHQLALAYCLRALCTQEARQNFEVILPDIDKALELWSSINWSVDVHPEMVIENAIPLLCCVVDLLSLKGYLKFHYDIYKLIIIFLKQKNIPLERCLAMLWADRRLFHSLCSSPVNEDFLVDFAKDFVVHSNSVGFWINCVKDSPELLIGFRQKFSLSDSSLAQLGHHHCGGPLGSDVTVDEVREVASALISRGNAPSSAFLAGYLYYDLSERFISNGQLFQALSYAKEAFRLRTKLLQKKFVCTFRQQPKSTSETEEVASQHEHDYIHLEVHGSVSTEVWPYTTDPYNSEGCILSQWNVLQCYLESLLQVGTIHEATGNATVAEALFLQGKHISCMEGLPVFRVAFASALGEIYYKKQHWDMADKELNSAKQILVDSSAIISCKRCKLTLEVTIDLRIGSLTKSRLNGAAMASSVNGLSLALDFYRSALKKLDLPEWKNSLSFSEETNPLGTKELTSQKAKSEGSHLIMVPKKSKTVSKHLSKEQSHKSSHMPMTRSRYRCSQNTCLQGEDMADSEDPKPSSDLDASSMPEIECEEACKITNCWRCVIMKVMECGTMQDFILMKWEYYRRKLSLRLLADIGKCIGVLGEIHKAHDFFWESINVLISRKTDSGTYSSIPRSLLLEFIGKERRWDIFAVERASILYNISWFSLRIQLSEYSRISCRDLSCIPIEPDLSCIQIEPIVSSLLQAFILCRELPLLFQKSLAFSGLYWPRLKFWSSVNVLKDRDFGLQWLQSHKILVFSECVERPRLLSVIFLLSTCGGPFSLPRYICKVLSGSHWAAYFHQASLGTYLNHQFLSNPSGQPNSCNIKDFEGSHATGLADTAPETCNLLRLAPERIDDLKKFVVDFFQGLPSVTSICISLLGGEFTSLLSDVLPFPSSFPAWILLSRLNSNAQPIVMILPADLISEGALENDTSSCQGSIPEGKDSSKKWHCPWGYTIVDDVAPQFKLILEENYLSSSISPTLDTQGNRLLWWTWRRNLNERLDKFLRDVEQSWLGPWKCLLLGEPSDCEHLRTVVSKLNADLKHKCQLDVNENLLRIILGGAMSVPQIEACISQLLLHKGYFIGKGGCWEKKYGPDYEVGSISLLPQQLILEAASKLGNECIDREPIVLVLDSEVQMLPWENLPVLRKQEAYRMPSVGSISVILSIGCHLEDKIGGVAANFPAIDPLDAFYLLNPSGDLNRTQIEFEEWFRDQKLEGKAGTPPTTEELVIALKNHDLFIYFGHGSGTQYIPGYEIQKLKNCAATLLMGCSSGSLSLMGCYNPQGAVLSYLLAGSPAIIANLWEVTDKDIDRFGKAMLNFWLEERSTCSTGTAQCSLVAKEFESMNIRSSKGNTKRKVTRGKKLKDGSHSSTCKVCCGHRPMIGSFMSQAREACTLPLLIGASPVCYGVPTGIRKKKDL